MNMKWVAVIFSLALCGCQPSSHIEPIPKNKPDSLSEGTLANEKLTSDTTAGLKNIVGESAITSQTKILKAVVQQPIGNPGVRVWREMWLINSQGTNAQFLITFRETGASGADFHIKRMNQRNPAPPANCPKTVGDYKVGKSTSQEIQNCLGSPYYENYNPDGRYVYLYKLDPAITRAFVFDASGKLINTRGYKQN
ncbi:hypothetical protein BK648_22850 [Pseudomonas poae]|uniref:Uncharacterized protein n=1 Tax=Pseudomonas poae TaxID=200451 RepID=A0A423EQQ0_9PSED|nr:hypothetical protein [Pseudomonas poae]ROM33630.1 hypothetical protein BK648_22850 [Pseudomonas poae]